MERCIQLARENSFQTLWLGVWEHNLRAQAFYKKYGFKMVGQHIFRLGTDDQVDSIMTHTI
jgi:ribosomal protein S18 acetylase RimI-like enzyme